MSEKVTEKVVEPEVVHSTFVVEKNYPKEPERVFAAFADPAKKRRWWAESDAHEIREFTMDFQLGGKDRLVYQFGPESPLPGMTITNEGFYQDIVENRRIVMAQRMTLGEKRIMAALLTIELLPARGGTDLICTHQGAYFDWPQGAQSLEQGWTGLIERLGKELSA